MLFIFTIIVILVLAGLSYILPVGAISDVYGSAMFAKDSILKPYHSGLVIDGQNRIKSSISYTHAAVIAGTGGGKTTKYILPNIIELATNEKPVSMVISDVKGELIELTAPYLKRQGYKVLILDFENPNSPNSIRYNPLVRVNSESEIKQFSDTLFTLANPKSTTDAIWKYGSSRIFQILIKALKNAPDQKLTTLSSIAHLLNQFGNADSTALDEFINKHGSKSTKATYQFVKSQETKILYGQLSTSQTSIAPFDTEEIRAITALDTLDFNLFRKEKVAMFLKLPIGVADQYNNLLSLFYMQFFKWILNTPLSESDHGIYLLIDEFGNLKKIPDLPRIISTIRSRRASLSLVLQSISQLDYTYSKDVTEIVLGNISSLIIYPGIREKRTLEYITTLLGTTTKEVHTPGSFGVSFYSRPLMTMEEIRTLDSSAGLFISGNRPVQKVRPIPIYKNSALMKKANIASVNGHLVTQSPEEMENHFEESIEMPPITIEEELENPKIRDFKARLKELLPND